MEKTIKILIYVAILLIGYFALSTIYKSCNTPNNKDVVETTQDEISSDEEDDFFENFDEDSDDISSEEHAEEPDAINYKSLDDKLEKIEEKKEVSEDEWVEEKPTPKSIEKKKPVYKNSNSFGNYLVVAGSFLVRSNADAMVSKLKKKGFDNAEVAVFDLSQYYTAIAARTNSKSEAINITNKLKKKGVDCYVHTKQ